jgi:hypothetical protein
MNHLGCFGTSRLALEMRKIPSTWGKEEEEEEEIFKVEKHN